jgi:hypothetical protein
MQDLIMTMNASLSYVLAGLDLSLSESGLLVLMRFTGNCLCTRVSTPRDVCTMTEPPSEAFLRAVLVKCHD